MILIDRPQTEPYFNIAAEEYVLREFDDDVFMLWCNKPSVIIGKHQVAAAETNIVYTHRNAIPVIRRISGGGTVYHDEGNLNYSLIKRGKMGQLVDYRKYAGTIIRALERFNLKAELSGKSSLAIDGIKFSGNAEHIYRDKVLHHGTLLFDSNLDELRKCIRPQHNGYDDKSIKSVDSKIMNLSQLLPAGMEMSDFKKIILDQLMAEHTGVKNYSFTEDDIKGIQKLVRDKYSGMEWNFAYSPRYKFNGTLILEETDINITLTCEKGMIRDIEFRNNGKPMWEELAVRLTGKLHHPGAIQLQDDDVRRITQSELKAHHIAESIF